MACFGAVPWFFFLLALKHSDFKHSYDVYHPLSTSVEKQETTHESPPHSCGSRCGATLPRPKRHLHCAVPVLCYHGLNLAYDAVGRARDTVGLAQQAAWLAGSSSVSSQGSAQRGLAYLSTASSTVSSLVLALHTKAMGEMPGCRCGCHRLTSLRLGEKVPRGLQPRLAECHPNHTGDHGANH